MSDVLDALAQTFELDVDEAAELLDLVAETDIRWVQARHGYPKDNAILPSMADRLKDPDWRAIFSAVVHDDDEMDTRLKARVLA